MVCIHIWRRNMTRINTLRLWRFQRVYQNPHLVVRYSHCPPEGAVYHVPILAGWSHQRHQSQTFSSVPLSSKDPFQEALIIKPFRYCALRLSLCFTVFYTLWFRYHITSALTRLSLYLSVTTIFYRHYISCPSQGNGQLHCTSWKNRCSHIKQFKIEIWGAALTKRDMVLDVPVCNSVLADAS